MKLELKAYKCVFPKLFIDAYNSYMWQDDKQFELIYGLNQKEAVKKRCTNDEFESYFHLKSNINTRRFPERDLYSLPKSELLKELNTVQISHLTHSLGVEIGDTYTGDFYRNYSMYHGKHEVCENLVKLGLMDNWQKMDSEVYGVSKIGIEAIKTLLLTAKPQE
tara:strand:- start:531 stop:1022 length:492 start_codon:yes stop_codon:yes gene_type:complete